MAPSVCTILNLVCSPCSSVLGKLRAGASYLRRGEGARCSDLNIVYIVEELDL